jgi:hypothetical protein
MKITHLSNNSRASIGITQGLMLVTDNLCLSTDYISIGKTLKTKSTNLPIDLIDSDLIFITDLECQQYLDLIDKFDLWRRVIVCDYIDSVRLASYSSRVRLYFKRSVSHGVTRVPVEKTNKVIPIHHCALNEYYQIKSTVPCRYDVGCFFSTKNIDRQGERRNNLLNVIKTHSFPNSLIDVSTGCGQPARLALSLPLKNNCFYDFMGLQQSCKIVFTAQPSHCEGDNRTWEAMASGALVFMDRSFSVPPMPLKDGEHCFIFDATNLETIHDAAEKAKWYLKHEKERREIAARGYYFVKRFHRPINRIQYVMKRCGFM